jgi:hypothetical protein
MTASFNIVSGDASHSLKLGNGEFFPRIDQIQKVIRDFLSLRRGWLGGADIHSAIDRHGVNADDFAITSLAGNLVRYG